jgi:hypothetical protein
MRTSVMKNIFFSVLSMCLTSSYLIAAEVVLKDPSVRSDYVAQGSVWSKPSWISSDFQFSPELNVASGPLVSGNDHLLMENTIICQMTEQDINPNSSGATPKFTCQLMKLDPQSGKPILALKKNGKSDKIKVKYQLSKGFREKQNMEVFGEVVGTRLLWSLGFSADRMFAADKVLCYGCTEDPFYDRRIDETTLNVPRAFLGVAIERKHEGTELVFENQPKVPRKRYGPPSKNFSYQPPTPEQFPEEGWSFKESMRLIQRDSASAVRDEKIKRDALRMLAVFIDHDDNKPENNRILCVGSVLADGQCDGEIKLIVQDLGAILGADISILKLKKARFDLSWGERSLWSNPKGCFGNIGITAINRDKSMMYPHISEEGRQFLMRLLNGFASGPEGRKRVEGLFEAAHVYRLNQTPQQWADAFMARLEKLNYPMGRENPHFACPKRIK